ncbi:MAG: YgiQ family radical SAM protein [Bacillota bacterium]|nr:YgiQ family radical SAM protein [Bacillota bacterium]
MTNYFLPISVEDMKSRGWDTLDFILISGDAYVDHPSFGTAIVSRLLEAKGFRVGIIAQPDWKNINEFKKLGKPKFAFLVTSGNIDSMVSHYTVAKKRRKSDLYSPGGKTGHRPDRALTIYSKMARIAYPDTPIIIGGIEASLRRLAHYDYWDDKVHRSVLLDAGADLLVYGMGENALIEIAEAMESGLNIEDITYVKGTVYSAKNIDFPEDFLVLPSFSKITSSRDAYAKSFINQYNNTDHITAKSLAEPYGGIYVIQNPPAEPLSTDELDMVYRLPYQKTFHPVYGKTGGVPALKEVRFSIVSSRGCFGGCSFCSLHFHQGRIIQNRSTEAVIEETKTLIKEPDFKGYIHDVGGPTANFYQKACTKQVKYGSCMERQCLSPDPCNNLIVDHSKYLKLLRQLRSLEGVKKVFVRSGIRYDYLLLEKNNAFFEELCEYHISGQLKVAPEHASKKVLSKMGKPEIKVYLDFKKRYKKINGKLGKDQYLVPYFMSSHPGADLEAAVELATFIKNHEHYPEQVQDFYPTPGTLSTCMYYTEKDPRTMEKIYIPKSPHEKAIQRALIQFKNPKNYQLVCEALKKTGRKDLIGYGRKCLVKPRKQKLKKRS